MPAPPRPDAPRRRLLAAALACAFGGLGGVAVADEGGAAPAAAAALPSVVLRPSLRLDERIPTEARRELPTFLFGDALHGQTDRETVLEGDAVLRRGDTVIRADRLRFDSPSDTARAEGHVRLNRAGNLYTGPELQLQVETFEGFFTQPTFSFLKNGGYGEAARADFIDDQHTVVHDVRYSSCRRTGPEWMPDWVLRAARVEIDNEQDVGVAQGAVLAFKNVPILPIPAFSFPLSDRRKSGFLPPTLDLDSVGGFTYSQPYYLNLAPNFDATLTPTLMTRRGVALGGEFRYLQPTYLGQVVGNFMPSDRLRDRDRWGLSAQHQQALPLGGGLALNFNRVSDANYWRDFTRGIAPLTQRLLPGDARLAWSGNGWDAQLRTLKWQTLQDVAAPIVPPYDRLPQLAVRYGVAAPRGWQYGIDLDHTRFRADALLTGQPNAQRSVLNARASYTWATPGSFLTPALRLSAARYAFDAPLANGSSRASRSVPSFSLDGGLVFERDTTYFGRAVRQTLEPRAFYTYTPYRDQSRIPIYDTAAKDFNFDSIFSDNPYVGNDRVADNNLLTLGLTSRLFDPATGGEAVRLGVAQRFRFTDQRVTLPGAAPVSERLSDMLFGGSVNWSASWRADASMQFNPKTGRSLRTTLGGRYSPGPYRVVNASYRLQNGVSELLDVGWQWPINDLWGDRGLDLGAGRGQGPGRWYSVGRLNYSLMDRKLVDTILGVEYDAGCWIGRIVFDRLQSGAATSSSRIMFQLEFVGFSRLGSNPLKTLRDNIPRYQYLREQTLPPSRFSNYD